MKTKRKLILSLSILIICLAFSFLAGKFILDSPYRNKLPVFPDFNSVSKPLQKQISVAGRLAYFNPSANNLGRLGMVYYSSTNYEKAKQCYKLALKQNSKTWIWSYYLGYLNLEQGESNASIENFKNVVAKDPNNYMALFYMGEAYYNIGLTDKAEIIFKKIAELNEYVSDKKDTIRENDFPLQTYASFRLARMYMNSDRIDTAEISLKKIVEDQIKFGPAYRLLGNVYNKVGDFTLANKYITRANDLLDYTPPSDSLLDVIALMSRSDTYLLKRIDDAIRSKNFNWALKLCKHGLKYIPNNKYLISKTMNVYLSLGLENKALSYLNQHFNYFSDDYNELISAADFLYEKGFTVLAMNYINQAIILKPENSRLVIWLLDRGMIKQADSLLNEQIKKEPENVKTLTDATRMMLKLGNKELAMRYFTQVKQLSPSGQETKKLAATIAEGEGNLKEALSIYEEVFRIDPKDLNVIKYLSAIYTRNEMWDKLLHHFRLALDSYPNEPYLLEGLGRLLISCPDPKFRNVEEGREYSERAYINFKSQYTTIISAGRNLATAYAEVGDKQKASKYINLTMCLANKHHVSQELIFYFESLKKQYNILN